MRDYGWYHNIPGAVLDKYFSMTPGNLSCFLNPLHFLPAHSWHERIASGNWDVARLLTIEKGRLIYSANEAENLPSKVDQTPSSIILQIDTETYVGIHRRWSGDYSLRTWAASRERAEILLQDLQDRYLRPPKRPAASFEILSISGNNYETVDVPVRAAFPRNRASLELHYGAQFLDWSDTFEQTLKRYRRGLSVLQGSPGNRKDLIYPIPDRKTAPNPSLLFYACGRVPPA